MTRDTARPAGTRPVDRTPARAGRRRDTTWLAHPAWAWAAVVWMTVFGLVHLYWALGGGLLLPDGLRVPDRTALFVVDVVAIPLCAAGALLAASFVTAAGQRIPRRWRLLAGWGAAALSLVHSASAIAVDLGRAVGIANGTWSTETKFSYLVYEPWWFLGGLLFLVATEGLRRRSA